MAPRAPGSRSRAPLIKLARSLEAWNTPAFEATFKAEFAALSAAELPLQQGLSLSSYVSDAPFSAMLISSRETAEGIELEAGVFYTGIIAGCSCADDPSPVDEQSEYCRLHLSIDGSTGLTRVALLADP